MKVKVTKFSLRIQIHPPNSLSLTTCSCSTFRSSVSLTLRLYILQATLSWHRWDNSTGLSCLFSGLSNGQTAQKLLTSLVKAFSEISWKHSSCPVLFETQTDTGYQLTYLTEAIENRRYLNTREVLKLHKSVNSEYNIHWNITYKLKWIDFYRLKTKPTTGSWVTSRIPQEMLKQHRLSKRERILNGSANV